MNYLEKWLPTAPKRLASENLPDVKRNGVGDLTNANYTAAKIFGGAVLVLIALGVAANFPQIRRYIRMELM
jgi:hypothetical protein